MNGQVEAKGNPSAQEVEKHLDEMFQTEPEDPSDKGELSVEAETPPAKGEGEAAAPEAEETELAKAPDPDAPEPKKKKGIDARFHELTEERNRLREEKARLAGRLEVLETLPAKPEPEPEPAETFQEPKPDIDEFESYEEFSEALIDWKNGQRDHEREQKAEAQRAEQEANNRAIEAYQREQAAVDKIMEAGEKKFAGFKKTIEAAPFEVFPHRGVAEIASESEFGPDIMHHLSQHPEESARIHQLGPVAAGFEIGQLHARFAVANKAPPKSTDIGPPSGPPGSTETGPEKDPEKLSDGDLDKWFEKQGVSFV